MNNSQRTIGASDGYNAPPSNSTNLSNKPTTSDGSSPDWIRVIPVWVASTAGLVYATGFLIDFTFLHAMGIYNTGAEDFKAKYIYLGMLCLQFPFSMGLITIGYNYIRSRIPNPSHNIAYRALRRQGLSARSIGHKVQQCREDGLRLVSAIKQKHLREALLVFRPLARILIRRLASCFYVARFCLIQLEWRMREKGKGKYALPGRAMLPFIILTMIVMFDFYLLNTFTDPGLFLKQQTPILNLFLVSIVVPSLMRYIEDRKIGQFAKTLRRMGPLSSLSSMRPILNKWKRRIRKFIIYVMAAGLILLFIALRTHLLSNGCVIGALFLVFWYVLAAIYPLHIFSGISILVLVIFWVIADLIGMTFGAWVRWVCVIIAVSLTNHIFHDSWDLLREMFLSGGYLYYGLMAAANYMIFFAISKRHEFGKSYSMVLANNICISITFAYLAVIVFSYRVFPYIPVQRGGGDYSREDTQSRFHLTHLILDSAKADGIPPEILAFPILLPQSPKIKSTTASSTESAHRVLLSLPLVVVNESSTTIFVVLPTATTAKALKYEFQQWRIPGTATKPQRIFAINRDAIVTSVFQPTVDTVLP